MNPPLYCHARTLGESGSSSSSSSSSSCGSSSNGGSSGIYSSRHPPRLTSTGWKGSGSARGIQFRSKPSWKGALRIRGGRDLGAAHAQAPPHHAPRSGATNYARWRPLARPWQRSSGSVVGRAPHTHQRAASAKHRVLDRRFAEWRNRICFSPLPRRATRFRPRRALRPRLAGPDADGKRSNGKIPASMLLSPVIPWDVGSGTQGQGGVYACFILHRKVNVSIFHFGFPLPPFGRSREARGNSISKQGESERRASYSGRKGSWRRPPASPTPPRPQIGRYELRTIATLGEALAA